MKTINLKNTILCTKTNAMSLKKLCNVIKNQNIKKYLLKPLLKDGPSGGTEHSLYRVKEKHTYQENVAD